MRLNYLANAIGLILLYISMVILIPVLIALFFKEWSSIMPFVFAGLIAAVLGFILKKIVKNASEIENLNDIRKGEGLFVVVASWVIFCIISAIPFVFYGLTPLNALFEATSGITTTGATILTNYNYPHTFFFWRSFTQWLGGLGIIVLFIAIFPQLAVAGRQLFFAEAPGPTEDKITPRVKNTASAIWKIYFALTLIEIVLLIFAGMPKFDAICNSLSTLSAGGFSPNEFSIMGYNSNLITLIVTFFMFLSGTSFILQYLVITKKDPLLFFRNDEFKMYLYIVILVSIAIGAAIIANEHYTIANGILSGFFQVISVITSTGFVSVNFTQWHYTPIVLLVIVMFIGSCASSAGGGIKITRWIIAAKSMKNELIKILHPNAVRNIKLDNKTVPTDVIQQIMMFIFFYFAIFIISSLLICLIEQNSLIGLTGSISTLGNIGPALGEHIGPMGNFSALHPLTKMIMIMNMLVGRLELIPFLVLTQRDFWSIKQN